MNDKRQSQEIEPGLLEQINLLEKTPDRDPELAIRTRDQFISEVDNLSLGGSVSPLAWLLGALGLTTLNNNQRSVGKVKFSYTAIAAILLVVVILFGGASATAYASQSALPGDALYPVKTGLEQTQITLANNAYNQAMLNLGFAQRRLDEIKELLAQGRTNDVEFASSEFEHYIQEAMKLSQIVQASDSERGAELSKLVSQALLDYAGALKSVLITAPEAVKPVVEKALLASQDGAGDEVEVYGVVVSITDAEVEIDGVIYSITNLTEFKDIIQPGDMVKIHVIKTQDGVMVVREIELTLNADDNSNTSGDDNSNESSAENSNDNLNDNESEDNENESEDNLNDNNSDDDRNENESENSGNDNDSGEDSSKSGSDDNSNDDSSNNSNSGSGSSNENDDDSSNENDSDDDHQNSNDSDDNSNDSDDDDKSGDD